MAWFFGILLIALLLGFSWVITCGVVWLVSMCFGFAFSWLIGTGVWIVALALSCIFNRK